MNVVLANIYGTAGMEKVASADMPSTLTELAQAIVMQDSDGNLEKVASATNEVLDTLVAYDRAGRSVAQQEFAGIEKLAAEGDTQALEDFFSDLEEEQELSNTDQLRQAVLEEIQRRTAE